MIKTPPYKNERVLSPLAGIQEGFRYACSRPELIGSYLIDFIAMVFGMPMALFPAIPESMGGPKTVGLVLFFWSHRLRISPSAFLELRDAINYRRD